VADVPRGGIGFFSLGQLSRFGTLYLHGEQDRIASLGKILSVALHLQRRGRSVALIDRVRGIKCVCLTEETVESRFRARQRRGADHCALVREGRVHAQ
jgi:hypothetical protein